MKEEMLALFVESQLNPEGRPLMEFEVMQMVLGKRSGYFRGMGCSVVLTRSSTTQNAQALKIKSLESELGEMQAKMKTQDKMAKLFEMLESCDGNLDSPRVGHPRDAHIHLLKRRTITHVIRCEK